MSGGENEILEIGHATESTGESTAGNSAETVSAEDLLFSSDKDLLRQIEEIPQKMAFKIGEVADIAGVKQYVLRYWESEFEILKPKKSNHNQRMYSRKDVEAVLLIKKLLYRDRFSISGARAVIRKFRQKVHAEIQTHATIKESLQIEESILERARQLVQDIRVLRESLE